MDNNINLVSWQTFEYIHKDKTADWYWIVGIVAISVALIAIILNNIIFGVLVIVAAFTLSLVASRKPDIITVEIDNMGVKAGKTRYPYTFLESFWIETRDAHPRVILKSKKIFMPYVAILTDDMDVDQIHDKLAKHLPEEEHVEPFLEKLMIHLGF